ncbi:MAG: DNA gyrase subunit A, partial [Clostridiales bacterium]|nr:DNA gyrase subunit A [Clostridiales bacterium]
IRAAYATGRGKVVVRAKAEIVEDKNGRFKIIVTEIPYLVNKAKLIESIANLVKDKRIDGISDINDYSSNRAGMQIDIDLKRDANPQVVLNRLYTYTQMQTTFGVIMLAIVGGEPKILSLKEVLQHYIDYQCEIITRRTEFDLKKAQERAHLLEGLLIALDFIDEVINIIRNSPDQPIAKQRLIERFELDDIQAQAIVQMRLGQLTGMERSKIEDEVESLKEKIIGLLEILGSRDIILGIIKTEVKEISDKFGDERRTNIESVSGEVDIEDLIPEETCMFTYTTMGYIKRQNIDEYKLQKRGGRGVKGMTRREDDVAETMFMCSTHEFVMFFTTKGRTYRLKGYEIPEGSRTSKGINIVNILPLEQGEKVSAMIRVPAIEDEKYICMVTRRGVIKRTALDAYKNVRKTGVIAINLDDEDELAWVKLTDGDNDLLVATKKGMSIRFSEKDCRPIGRTARGVKAITLAQGDEVVGMSVLREGGKILTVSETGFGRRSDESDYRRQSRAGKGLINYKTKKYGEVAAIRVVDNDDDVIIISTDGIIIRIPAEEIRECSRPSKGVIVMKVNEGEKVATLSRVLGEDLEDNEGDIDTGIDTETSAKTGIEADTDTETEDM